MIDVDQEARTVMRRAANEIFKSLKDQVRTVRYSIRAEAEAPGSMLPEVLHDLKPVLAIGSPALRLADGLFTEVGTLASGLLVPTERTSGFPLPLQTYLDDAGSLSGLLYGPVKAILAANGVRAMLVSERALDQAGDRFRARVADGSPRGRPMDSGEIIRASAALIQALVEARPIRKVTFGAAGDHNPNVMLSPNLVCAVTVGIASGLVTLKPELATDEQAVLDSAQSVANIRFARFSRALVSKAPEVDLARELEILLPFLP